MEPQLSKQVFNMLSGSSSLAGKHMHTLAHRHKAHQDGTGSALCGMERGDGDGTRMVSIRGQRQ